MFERSCVAWLLAASLSACCGCKLPSLATGTVASNAKQVDHKQVGPQSKLALARLSERRGNTIQARLLYEACCRENPNDPTAYHRLGVVAATSGNLPAARHYFAQALQHGEPSVDLLNDFGYCCYLQNDLKPAEAALGDALKREPANAGVCNNLALAVGAQGRYHESLALFQRAMPEAEAHANQAFVLVQAGRESDAERHYHQALALNGDLKPAAEAMVQMAEHSAARDLYPSRGMLARSDAQQPHWQQPIRPAAAPGSLPATQVRQALQPIQPVPAIQPQQVARRTPPRFVPTRPEALPRPSAPATPVSAEVQPVVYGQVAAPHEAPVRTPAAAQPAPLNKTASAIAPPEQRPVGATASPLLDQTSKPAVSTTVELPKTQTHYFSPEVSFLPAADVVTKPKLPDPTTELFQFRAAPPPMPLPQTH